MAHPTPYPEVNAVLQALLSGVQDVLGDCFVGMYLYGSLAGGDFCPQRSDIDFVVATADVLPDEMIVALEAMHARIAEGNLKWAAKLEAVHTSPPRSKWIAVPLHQRGTLLPGDLGERLGDPALHLAGTRGCGSGAGPARPD